MEVRLYQAIAANSGWFLIGIINNYRLPSGHLYFFLLNPDIAKTLNLKTM